MQCVSAVAIPFTPPSFFFLTHIMRLSILLSLTIASLTSALPVVEQPVGTCSKPRIRKEWYVSQDTRLIETSADSPPGAR